MGAVEGPHASVGSGGAELRRRPSKAMSSIAITPEPPYYAVIFSSQRTEGDRGYANVADRMAELAAKQPGFLGIETVRGANGFGITVSYWTTLEAISAWKRESE